MKNNEPEELTEDKELSARQLNLDITLLGAAAGVPVPQNKEFSEHSNDPLPDDIRGNKKEGDEYATIGTVLEKGGKLKVIVIAVAVLCIAFAIGNGLLVWGGLGSIGKYFVDYKSSGIAVAAPDDEELARIAAIDPEAVSARQMGELLKYHTQGGLRLTVKRSESGAWNELYSKKLEAKEAYLFVTGDPSSDLLLHIIADDKGTKHRINVDDSTYGEDPGFFTMADQDPLSKELAIGVFCRDYDTWSELQDIMDDTMFSDILKETVPDGCYLITAQDWNKPVS